MDPFGVTCDPRLYVPRPASEAALAALREGLAAGRRLCVFSGPAGLGKTMVLHVLAERLPDARCVHLPYAALALEDLAEWTLEKLGEPRGQGAAHSERLCAAARREAESGRTLVLLLDDASAIPLATARSLRALVDQLAGALRVVAVPVDDGRASAAIAAFGEGVLHVRMRAPLESEEVRHYLRERIAQANRAGASIQLSAEQIEWVVAESGGVPRIVNVLATWLSNPLGASPGVFAPPGAQEDLRVDGEDAALPLGEEDLARDARADAAAETETGPEPAELTPEPASSVPEPSPAPPAVPTRPARNARSSMLRRRARRMGRRY